MILHAAANPEHLLPMFSYLLGPSLFPLSQRTLLPCLGSPRCSWTATPRNPGQHTCWWRRLLGVAVQEDPGSLRLGSNFMEFRRTKVLWRLARLGLLLSPKGFLCNQNVKTGGLWQLEERQSAVERCKVSHLDINQLTHSC